MVYLDGEEEGGGGEEGEGKGRPRKRRAGQRLGIAVVVQGGKGQPRRRNPPKRVPGSDARELKWITFTTAL